jgi:multidrug efflux pump
MKYLPITLIVTLTASLIYALIFAPTIGAMFAKAHVEDPKPQAGRSLHGVVAKGGAPIPRRCSFSRSAAGRRAVQLFQYGKGVEFFPNVEPDYGLMYVSARGNLSLPRWTAPRCQAEERLLGWPGVSSVYTRVGQTSGRRPGHRRGRVGIIQYEFVDWRERKPAGEILDDLRGVDGGHSRRRGRGAVPEAGPPTGQAIQAGCRRSTRPASRTRPAVAAAAGDIPGVIDISTACRRPASTGRSGRPRQGLAIRHQPRHGRHGRAAGDQRAEAVGLPSGRRRRSRRHPPAPAEDRRTLATLDQLRVETSRARCRSPTSSRAKPEPRTGTLNRIDGERTIVVSANVASGLQAAVPGAGGPGAGGDGSRRHPLAAGRLERGTATRRRLPGQCLRRRDLPDLRGASGPVQQIHQRVPDPDDRGHVDHRRLPRPADHRASPSASSCPASASSRWPAWW